MENKLNSLIKALDSGWDSTNETYSVFINRIRGHVVDVKEEVTNMMQITDRLKRYWATDSYETD